MKTYTAQFITDAERAEHDFKANTAAQALQMARELWERDPESLQFQSFDMLSPLNGIIVEDEDAGEVIEWTDPDTSLRLAAQDLLDALEAQTEAAQAVIDAWEKGDLAGAVNTLEGFIPAARATIAKAKGGAP